MSDPISFESTSPRFGLPMLFVGQAQKEFFVNEAHALLDALLHGAIEGVANAPPASPAEGCSWLVDSAPSGEWDGQAGRIASRQGGNWLFTTPCDGMRLLNRESGQDMRYSAGWQAPARPAEPSGGATIDREARVAISQLISALVVVGAFPAG